MVEIIKSYVFRQISSYLHLANFTGCTYIHHEREANYSDIELHKAVILDTPILDQPLLNGPDKIPIENGVDDEVDNLFAPIPNLVDMNISIP